MSGSWRSPTRSVALATGVTAFRPSDPPCVQRGPPMPSWALPGTTPTCWMAEKVGAAARDLVVGPGRHRRRPGLISSPALGPVDDVASSGCGATSGQLRSFGGESTAAVPVNHANRRDAPCRAAGSGLGDDGSGGGRDSADPAWPRYEDDRGPEACRLKREIVGGSLTGRSAVPAGGRRGTPNGRRVRLSRPSHRLQPSHLGGPFAAVRAMAADRMGFRSIVAEPCSGPRKRTGGGEESCDKVPRLQTKGSGGQRRRTSRRPPARGRNTLET